MASVTRVGTGGKAGAQSNTTATVSYTVSSRQTGDLHLMFLSYKREGTPTFSGVSGWTEIGRLGVGTGSDGVDTGLVKLVILARTELTGTDSSPTGVGLTGSTSASDGWQAWIVTYRASVSTETIQVAWCGGGSDTSSGTGFSATSSISADLTDGDQIISFSGVTTDAGTFSSRTLSSSAGTLGTQNSLTGSATTDGNDHYSGITDRAVTTGASGVTFTQAITLGSASTGGSIFIVIRAVQICSPTAISSAEVFGSVSVTAPVTTLSPSAISSSEAFGTAVLSSPIVLTPTATASAEAFGTHQINVVISPTAIASAESFGTVVLTRNITITSTAITSAEAFGTAVLSSPIVITATAIASSEAFGTHQINVVISPTAIVSAETFGTVVITRNIAISPTAIASAEAFGTTVISGLIAISPTAIASAEAFGTVVITRNITISPTAIASSEVFGTSVVTVILTSSPNAISSSEAFGTSALSGATTLSATGIATAEAVGSHSATQPQTLVIRSIWSQEQVAQSLQFEDRFDRSSIGSNWIMSNTGGNVHTISNNELAAPSGLSCSRQTDPISGTDSMVSEFIFTGGEFVGLCLALDAFSSGTGYANVAPHYIYRQANNGQPSQFARKDNGAATHTNLINTGTTWQIGDHVRFEYNPSNGDLKGYINGVLDLSYTDVSPITGQRYAGIHNNKTTQQGVQVGDNWSAGQVLDGTTVVTRTIPLNPTPISSAETFGTAVMSGVTPLSPSSITSQEAFGTLNANVKWTLSPSAISSAEAFGTVVRSGIITISPTSVSSTEAFGTVTRTGTISVSPPAISSAEAFGAAVLNAGYLVSPTAIASAQAFGTVVLTRNITISPTAISSAEAFGTHKIYSICSPTAIASAEVFGTVSITRNTTVYPRSIFAGIVNYQINSSFELDTNSDGLSDNWSKTAGTHTRITSPWGTGMAQQMVVTTNAQDTRLSSTSFAFAKAGDTLVLKTRYSGPNTRILMGLEYFYSTTGGYFSGNYIVTPTPDVNGWVKHQVTCPFECRVKPMFYTGSNGLAGDTHIFDEVLFTVGISEVNYFQPQNNTTEALLPDVYMGSPSVSSQTSILPSGIASGNTFGNPSMSGQLTVLPSSILSQEVVPSARLTGDGAIPRFMGWGIPLAADS